MQLLFNSISLRYSLTGLGRGLGFFRVNENEQRFRFGHKIYGQCYTTFFGRKLRLFKRYSVCPWQAFPAQSNVLLEPTRERHISGAPL
jgi:hypothetical protein